MRILIFIASRQKGFFVSLGRLLAADGHQVSFAARDKNVAALIRRLAPDLAGSMAVTDDFAAPLPEAEVLARAAEVEARYGVRLSFLLSYDRALGRGYIFNADRYPAIGRARWSQLRKLQHVLERFALAEHLLDTFSPDLLLAVQKDEIVNVVAKARGVAYMNPAAAKIGTRYFWSDNQYITSTAFLDGIRENLARGLEGLPPVEGYDQDAGSKFNHAKLRFTWTRACKEAAMQVLRDTKALVSGSRKKDSYPFLGWVPYLFRRPAIYRYCLRLGRRPEDLAGRRTVYIPLHLEPEIALLAISPEFNNSMEMIAWISKAAPADVLLVVKEQPYSFGVRSRRYYEQLLQISNVVLAHPETTSWEWIRSTTVTATITGTAGTEAVMFGKPVLSFGRHQAVNLLPTVRLARDYEGVREGLDALLALDPQDDAFELSRRALYQAQLSASFDLAGYQRTTAGLQLEDDLAARALAALKPRLQSLYPGQYGPGQEKGAP